MPTRPDFVCYCMDLLACVGPVQSRRMFGGYGLYLDDVFVAIVTGDNLYMKTDSDTQPRFAAAGGIQFCFTSRGKLQPTHFWSPPADAMDSPDLMRPWAQLAHEAAVRAKAIPKKRR